MFDSIRSIDFSILDFIRDNLSCDFLDFIMPKIAFLGNAGMIWIATALVLLCIKKYRKNGIILAVGLICGVIVGNLILKNLIARDRPCWLNETIPLLVNNPKDFSFPSGHTLSSVIAAIVLMRTNRVIGIPALVLAILIAFSRLYLYVHFPSDVLCGALLGIVIGFSVSLICEKKISFFKKTSEVSE